MEFISGYYDIPRNLLIFDDEVPSAEKPLSPRAVFLCFVDELRKAVIIWGLFFDRKPAPRLIVEGI